jgi:hypothetical protein
MRRKSAMARPVKEALPALTKAEQEDLQPVMNPRLKGGGLQHLEEG